MFQRHNNINIKDNLHTAHHHQGACAQIHALPLQVHSPIGQHHSATSTAYFAEQHDGGQRELLQQYTRGTVELIHLDQ